MDHGVAMSSLKRNQLKLLEAAVNAQGYSHIPHDTLLLNNIFHRSATPKEILKNPDLPPAQESAGKSMATGH